VSILNLTISSGPKKANLLTRHEETELTSINHFGLVYTLKGSDKKLKPILFAAHQDVVPATSLDKWTHPPFEAYFDGKYVYGRGSSDCKNNLIGLLSVLESFLQQEWKPKRTIILAFGFDEEIGGERGAKNIAIHLEKKYGRNGIAMIVDEGGMGVEVKGDFAYALPAVAEKGFLDVHLKLEVKGGHSSRPPPHSGIGVMAELIVALEANPFKPRLTKTNPFRGFLECQVKYSPKEVESWLKDALIKGEDEAVIGMQLADARGDEVRFSMQTSQAVDVINAGDATNQLPETVETIVNYRIAPHDSIASVKRRVREMVTPIAKKHNIMVYGFGMDNEVPPGSPVLRLSSADDLSPSPITPTGSDSKVWNLFGGTIRQVFEDVPKLKGKTVVPVGDIMTGKQVSN
jgi:Gly-Xaa carboxypeptidase